MQQDTCSICKRFVILLGCVLVSAGVSPLHAEQAAPLPCQEEIYRAFDFWSGEWDVFMADGTLAGHNTINAEQQGCVLIEHWQGSTGGTGVSMNYYDLERNQWRQLWISPGTQIDIAGGMRDGSMVLQGRITYLKDGSHFPFRGSWTPREDGSVRQFFEEAREPADWQPWFEGFYRTVNKSKTRGMSQ